MCVFVSMMVGMQIQNLLAVEEKGWMVLYGSHQLQKIYILYICLYTEEIPFSVKEGQWVASAR